MLDDLHKSGCDENQVERKADDGQRLPDEVKLLLLNNEIDQALVLGLNEKLKPANVTGVRTHRHDPIGNAALMHGGEDAATVAGHDEIAGLAVALRRKADSARSSLIFLVALVDELWLFDLADHSRESRFHFFLLYLLARLPNANDVDFSFPLVYAQHLWVVRWCGSHRNKRLLNG